MARETQSDSAWNDSETGAR